MEFIFGKLIGTFWSHALGTLAYGPWPSFVQKLIIRIYRKLYQIQWEDISQFKNLGEFFLREITFPMGDSELVSPAECAILEGPTPIDLDAKVSVKGISYRWKDFHEWDERFSNGYFYNLYLAPPDYHWIHSPSDARNVKAIRTPGLKIPVNSLGRIIARDLYIKNDRVSFQFDHPTLGRIWMIMVGAMGVSKIRSEVGSIHETWTPVSDFKKGQRIAGFELGSSILLVIEKNAKFFEGLKKLQPGFNLLRQ